MGQIFTAKDAKTRFGQLLDESRIAPVQITKNGRSCAYLVSAEDYMKLTLTSSDPYVLFSKGQIGWQQAVKDAGVRDYAQLLIELGKKSFSLPILPEDQLTEMKNVFVNVYKNSKILPPQ